MADERRRATSIEEMGAKLHGFITEESIKAGRTLVPRPTDVFISPFAKCGTTWLQQIVHSLRTGGDLDFDDISRVVPWVDTALDLGIDIDAEQRANPRAFKSHASWDDINKGGRYIMSARDPRDAMVSQYRFFEGWFFEPGSITLDDMARRVFLAAGNYYTHLASWWPHRDDDNVLFLAYELMLKDTEATVRRIARFVGIDADDGLIALALEQSSLEAMSRNKDKYDDLMMRERSEKVANLPPGSDSSKVRVGKAGGHRHELSADVVAELDQKWRDTMGAQFGLDTYEDLLRRL